MCPECHAAKDPNHIGKPIPSRPSGDDLVSDWSGSFANGVRAMEDAENEK